MASNWWIREEEKEEQRRKRKEKEKEEEEERVKRLGVLAGIYIKVFLSDKRAHIL